MGIQTNSGIKAPEFRSLPTGCASAFEFAIRFDRWWQARGTRDRPTWQEVAGEWNVDRATAFRWRSAYMAALGLVEEPAPRPVRREVVQAKAEHPWRKEGREAMARRSGVGA